MKTVLRLAWAHVQDHPLRLILTSLATAAAAAMVIWVVSGYDALLTTFDEYSNLALGRYELSIAPINHFSQVAPGAIPSPAEKFVPEYALDYLNADPAVRVADPMWVPRVSVSPYVAPGAAAPPSRRLPDVRVVGTLAEAAPFDLVRGRWINTHDTNKHEAVMSASAAAAYGTDIGGHILLGDAPHQTKIEIVGLVNTPDVEGWSASVARSQMMTPGIGGLFISMPLLEQISAQTRRISFIGVGLKPEADLTSFRFQWSPRLSQLSTPSQFQEAHDIEEALDESASAENLKMQAQTATVVSMLAALFIILSTLNMGVSERVRQLAILRAVALTRFQIASLILVEALLLATIGFVVGCVSGWVIMWSALKSAPELLYDGAVVGTFSILLAAVCAYGGALLASLWPAIRAMRVRPLEAMGSFSQEKEAKLSRLQFISGSALIMIYPIIAHVWVHHDQAPFALYMFTGVLTTAAGFILWSPGMVVLVDRFCSPMLARLLRIPPKLLLSQISASLARTVSTAIALTIGLGLLIAIHVWGHSMLSGFLPGAWAPDALIAFRPDGIDPQTAKKSASWDGVRKALPIIVEQPRLKQDLTNSAKRATVVRQDNIVLVGVNAQSAFDSSNPLFQFEWVDGHAQKAIELLQSGRACIVPDHFLREAKLKVGDSFELVPPEKPEQVVSYTIAAAVKMPGWHWQTKPTGMRTRTHRSAALVFANYHQVEADFQFKNASHIWCNYDPALTSPTKLAGYAQQLLSGAIGKPVAIGDSPVDQPYIQVTTIEEIRDIVRSHSRQWLWVLSRLPIVILIITTVGVLNALLASVQARRWDMGILRSLGFTRSMLVRLVVAEGVLIGLVASILSLGFGILAGWCGAGISRYISFFGGMNLELIIPWPEVLSGMLAVILLSSLAAAWPAFSLGRTKPLELLQQGRSTF